MTIAIEDIRRAAEAIRGAVVETPTIQSRLLSELSGARLFLKMENLQYTASFKERGALVRLLSLSPEQRRRGVGAMSAGNHALGVAYHAQRLGIPATIVMPRGTPFVKVANTHYHGARVVLHGDALAGPPSTRTSWPRARGSSSSTPSTIPSSSPVRARSPWKCSVRSRTWTRWWCRSAAAG